MSLRLVVAIMANEQRRLRRHKEVALFGLALPIIIISLIGLTFGTTGSIDLGVLDLDGTARSAALVARFEGRDGIDLERYDDLDDLRQDVRTTGIQAGVVIPDGYADALATGGAAVRVVAEPRSEGVASALAAVQGAVSQEGVEEAAVAFVAGATAGGDEDARRLVEAQAAGLEPVEVVASDVVGTDVDLVSFSHTAPGNLVLFVFVNTFVIATIVAFDRQGGLVRRMLGTPTSARTIAVGLGASKLAFALVQSALLVGIGALAFGVEWGDPLAAAILVVVFAAVSTAIGLVVGATVANAEQAQAIGIPLAIGMGMLGGCMWPLDIVPRPMQLVGHVTPHAWAMDSWEELIFEGASLADILPNLLVLAGIALLVGTVAARQLRHAVTG